MQCRIPFKKKMFLAILLLNDTKQKKKMRSQSLFGRICQRVITRIGIVIWRWHGFPKLGHIWHKKEEKSRAIHVEVGGGDEKVVKYQKQIKRNILLVVKKKEV